MASNEFVCPKREIMTIFDIAKWYKSEVCFLKVILGFNSKNIKAYLKYLTWLKKINHSVKSVPTTSSKIVVSLAVQSVIDLLDTLEVFIYLYKYLFQREFERKIVLLFRSM